MRQVSSANILLVEDNPGDAKLLMSLCQLEGFAGKFHWVTDGEAALNFLFRRTGHESVPRPDLVLLDLNLPRVHGREVLAEIQRDVAVRAIPVIVMSTSSNENDLRTSLALNASAFVTKPKDLSEYDVLVRRLIREDLPRALQRH